MQTISNQAKRPINSVKSGFSLMKANKEIINVWFVIFLGNFLGWLTKWLYTFKITGNPGWGPLGGWEFVLQLFFSVIASIIITSGIWPKLKDLDPTYRYFVAFAAGATTNVGIDLLINTSTAASAMF